MTTKRRFRSRRAVLRGLGVVLACMHGGNHQADQLPLALIGAKNLGVELDQHLAPDARPLRDLYFTLLADVFGVELAELGQNLTGAPLRRIDGLLKA